LSLRALIIEDEPVVVDRLFRMVRQSLLPDAVDLSCAGSLPAARQALAGADFDFVFLDLNLVGADGFELVRASVLEAGATIVISASIDRAIEAYELGIADFVPKPFDQARLDLALSRARSGRDMDRPARYLAVEGRGVIEPIPVSMIERVQAAGNYAELVLTDGSLRLYEQTMDRLERSLPARFQRVHRSHIVDVSLIARIEVREGSRYECVLASKARIPVGRTRIAELKDRLTSL